jgi:predicted glycosyltransferase involved in capsule biosynthesis
MISVIIPVKEDDLSLDLGIWSSLERARKFCLEEVEVLVLVNKPSFGRVNAKNLGAGYAKGETLVFLDCDCIVSSNFLQEVSQKSKKDYFVGGGTKYIKLSRYSMGIVSSMFLLGLFMLLKQITLGAFWIKKQAFFEMGGFRQRKYDDIDFALRLRKYAKRASKKFESIKESFLIWDTRKYDTHGDWHWLKGYHTS